MGYQERAFGSGWDNVCMKDDILRGTRNVQVELSSEVVVPRKGV